MAFTSSLTLRSVSSPSNRMTFPNRTRSVSEVVCEGGEPPRARISIPVYLERELGKHCEGVGR